MASAFCCSREYRSAGSACIVPTKICIVCVTLISDGQRMERCFGAKAAQRLRFPLILCGGRLLESSLFSAQFWSRHPLA